jgi:hypothetical protein
MDAIMLQFQYESQLKTETEKEYKNEKSEKFNEILREEVMSMRSRNKRKLENITDTQVQTNIVNKNNKKPNKSDENNLNEEQIKQLFSLITPSVNMNNGNKTINKNPNQNKQTKIQCNNPKCNHKTYEEDSTEVTKSTMKQINDIDDLIELGRTYHCKKNKEYCGLNLKILCNLVTPLMELKNMIGLKNVKTNIVDQILYFLRGYNKNSKCNMCVECAYDLPCPKNQDDMLHTVITGPPGVGKTQLGKVLGKVYKEMGILSKGHFKLVKRSDLIGKYLGHTAAQTQDVINQCAGGVMFIDEAYALGHSEGRDSFSKECLDTLNQNLEEKRDFLCIIAGYKDALEKCFFSMNDGLRRRFTFRYDIEGYSAKELMEIFLLKVKLGGWRMEFDTPEDDSESTKIKNDRKRIKLEEYFEENDSNFPNYGGDIETLFLNCKIAHCRKMTLLDPQDKSNSNSNSNSTYNEKVIYLEDVKDGMTTFLSSRSCNNDIPSSIYY